MNTKHSLYALPILAAALVGSPAFAQGGDGSKRVEQHQGKQDKKAPAVKILAHDKIVGASVTNGAEGEKGKTLGSIGDLVVDGAKGQVTHAILTSGTTLGLGGKQTKIAWDAFTWDHKNTCFALTMTPEDLKKLPEYQLKKDLKAGARNAEAKKDNAKAGEAVEARTPKAMKPDASQLLVSELRDCQVHASKDNLGAGANLYIEPKSGTLALVSIAVGGVAGIGDSNYVIPWTAIELVKPADAKGYQMRIAKTKKTLESAPKLEDKGADVNSAPFRMRIYDFYQVQPPAFDSKLEVKGTGGQR